MYFQGHFRDDGGLRSRSPNPQNPCGYLRGWTYEEDDKTLVQDFKIPPFARDWFAKLPKKEVHIHNFVVTKY